MAKVLSSEEILVLLENYKKRDIQVSINIRDSSFYNKQPYLVYSTIFDSTYYLYKDSLELLCNNEKVWRITIDNNTPVDIIKNIFDKSLHLPISLIDKISELLPNKITCYNSYANPWIDGILEKIIIYKYINHNDISMQICYNSRIICMIKEELHYCNSYINEIVINESILIIKIGEYNESALKNKIRSGSISDILFNSVLQELL